MYEHERSLVKRLQDKPFALIGVNSDKDRKELKKVLKDEKITWRSFWNGGGTDGPISRAWNVTGWPSIWVIDAQGVVRHKWRGSPGGPTLDKAVEALLAEMDNGDASTE
jgi:hypothetical protein